MISDELKCIFIHVPKTGGSSIADALRHSGLGFRDIDAGDCDFDRLPVHAHGYLGENAWSLRHTPARFLHARYQGFRKFAVVRNPWDLVVSCYHWWIQNTRQNFRRLQGQIIDRLGFTDFALSPYTDYLNEIFHAGQGQTYFTHDQDRNCLVEQIIRFESLETGFLATSKTLGIRIETLAHANATRHARFACHYTPLSAEMVRRKFARDIETFGYDFHLPPATEADWQAWLLKAVDNYST